jgi:signal transduction histidine kinase
MIGLGDPSYCLGDCIRQWGLEAELVRAIEDAVSTGNTYSQKESSLGKGENCLNIKWDVVPLLGDDTAILGAILLFKDVTREVNLRRQLQESERLAIAGEVAASLAHEIRNPLTVALGSLQFFSMVDNPNKQRELLEMTRNELKRMNHILTNFLNLSKPSQSAEIEEIDPKKEIDELMSLMKSEAILNDIDLEYLPCPEKLPTVKGSKNDLKQVCLNVAKNAIEAMEPGGKLSISLHKRDTHICITFRDTGPGISEENLKNIFRPFFTTKLTGTGLGLYICQSIVKDMGGELRFESKLGQGTSAHIILPTAPVKERLVI